MERKLIDAMVHLDQKLIFIPLVFIFLRMWGTLRFFISFAPSCHVPCGVKLTVEDPCKSVLYHPLLMAMQALCDPGQGWGNALIFVVFNKTILKRICPCAFLLSSKLKRRYWDPSAPSVNKIRDKDPLVTEEEEDADHTPIVSDTPIMSDENDRRRQRTSYTVTSSHM